MELPFSIIRRKIKYINFRQIGRIRRFQDHLSIFKRIPKKSKKISIGTDLKHEYREAIDKLKVKHHFCKFHVKQNINKRFKDYFDKNQLTDKEKEPLIDLKQDIYKILDAETLNDAKKLRDMLIAITMIEKN